MCDYYIHFNKRFYLYFCKFTFEHLHCHLSETRGLGTVNADGLGQNNLTEAALAQRLPQSQPEYTQQETSYWQGKGPQKMMNKIKLWKV